MCAHAHRNKFFPKTTSFTAFTDFAFVGTPCTRCTVTRFVCVGALLRRSGTAENINFKLKINRKPICSQPFARKPNTLRIPSVENNIYIYIFSFTAALYCFTSRQGGNYPSVVCRSARIVLVTSTA